MKVNDFLAILSDCCNDITFVYNKKNSGIMSEVADFKKTYHMWYGDKDQKYSSVDDLMSDPFFDGQSLRDIFSTVDIWVS